MRRPRWILVATVGAAVALVLPAASQGKSAPPTLAWSWTGGSGTTYDFGALSSTASVTFTLTNTGGRSSGTVMTIDLSGSSAFSIGADGCTGNALGPGRSCEVTVEYAPATSIDSATLTASGEHASASLSLSGSYLPVISFAVDDEVGTTSTGNLLPAGSSASVQSVGLDVAASTNGLVASTPTLVGGYVTLDVYGGGVEDATHLLLTLDLNEDGAYETTNGSMADSIALPVSVAFDVTLTDGTQEELVATIQADGSPSDDG